MSIIKYFRQSKIREDVRNFFANNKIGKLWCSEWQDKAGLAYSCGLILVKQKPLLKTIQMETGEQIVNLSDFLCEETKGWDIEKAFMGEWNNLEDGGELLADEVVIPKENTTKMDAKKVHCNAQKRVLLGQEYIVLVWTKGAKIKVIGVEKVDESKDRGKFKLALKMIDEFIKLGYEIKGIRVDGWYFKENFWKDLKGRQLNIVSRPRRDSKWLFGYEELNLNKYAERIPPESFHYYSKEQVYAKAITAYNLKYGFCKIVIIKRKRTCPVKEYIFVVSSNLDLNVRQIIQAKKNRWKIEVIFRDCSQNLGLKHCQCYRNGASESHVAMVFLTYNFLADIKLKEGGSIGRLKRKFIADYNTQRTRLSAFLDVKYAA